MLNTGMKLLVSCALVTAFAAQAQAQTAEAPHEKANTTREGKAATDKTVDDILGGKSPASGQPTADGSSVRNRIKAGYDKIVTGVGQEHQGLRDVVDAAGDGLKLAHDRAAQHVAVATAVAAPLVDVALQHATTAVDALRKSGLFRGTRDAAQGLLRGFTTIARENPSNLDEITKAATALFIPSSENPKVAQAEIDVFQSWVKVIQASHGANVTTHAARIVELIKGYKGTPAEEVEAEILKRTAVILTAENGRISPATAERRALRDLVSLRRPGMTEFAIEKEVKRLLSKECV